VAHHGFGSDFIEHFGVVSPEDGSICGRAMKQRQTVFVDDVTSDKDFVEQVEYAENAGFRTVISTPLISSKRNMIGVISTHFNLPHRFTKEEVVRFEKFCSRAADTIEEFILDQ
jgi:GAF domain-containing protein